MLHEQLQGRADFFVHSSYNYNKYSNLLAAYKRESPTTSRGAW